MPQARRNRTPGGRVQPIYGRRQSCPLLHYILGRIPNPCRHGGSGPLVLRSPFLLHLDNTAHPFLRRRVRIFIPPDTQSHEEQIPIESGFPLTAEILVADRADADRFFYQLARFVFDLAEIDHQAPGVPSSEPAPRLPAVTVFFPYAILLSALPIYTVTMSPPFLRVDPFCHRA